MNNTETEKDQDQVPQQGASESEPTFPDLPEDGLIIVPVRGMVMFPGIVLPVAIGRPRSIAAVQEAVRRELPIGLLLQRDPEADEPTPEELYSVGVVATILRYVTAPDGSHHVVCQGEQRFRVKEFVEGYPFYVARVERLTEPEEVGTEVEALMRHLQQQALEAIKLTPQAPPEFASAIENAHSPGALADLVTSFADFKPDEKQQVLEALDLESRLKLTSRLLSHQLEVLRLTRQIEAQTKESMDKRQREYLLREQLQTIQKELGEADEKELEIQELEEAIAEAKMPEEVEEHARKELKRLAHMPEGAGEYSMVRTYLDWLVSLPWSVTSEENIDIAHARKVLDEDHYGLEKVKKRIIEYLAVRKLNPHGRSPILCFVGPPGVGKTSLGKSIARAIGLKFVRASLGGVHDEAEIRGHRRTYLGALPGTIIQGIRKAGTRNPVFMLDEMDKLGTGFHGDPSAALLEVLDPEQNSSFRDNYLGVPFDLSRVFFIGTANVLDTIPGPLRDRMEILEIPGYTEEEKLEIARRYLVQRQLEANGLKPGQARVSDEALREIIRYYTREAGCRNLEREIGAVFRFAAVRIAEGAAQEVDIDIKDLQEILGPRRYENEIAMRTSVAGVATGLAWTPVGGDILFVEATKVPGHGKLILTGQLGDVMKESAQAALTLVKSKAHELGIENEVFDKNDLHIHVPAGAIPKDGPSAGVAMFIALVSLFTDTPVNHELAMTGEISLRGLVLPVGGIKEKVVAASSAGIKTVMLPARNRKDLDDIPESARKRLKFVWLETVDDAIWTAFDGAIGLPPERRAGLPASIAG